MWRVSQRTLFAINVGMLIGAIVLIVFLRSPEVFITPSLEAEDGAFVFPYYYRHREISELFRPMHGYIALGVNAIAYGSVRLPTTLIPYGFTLTPFLLA